MINISVIISSEIYPSEICLSEFCTAWISNELGGRFYRLDLREEYMFEMMLMRMTILFFRP